MIVNKPLRMEIKNITVFGSGAKGCQIAFRAALYGFNVKFLAVNYDALIEVRSKFEKIGMRYLNELGVTELQVGKAQENLTFTVNMSEAMKDADLIIETIAENEQIQKSFYQELERVAPEKSIFASTSSTLLSSHILQRSSRPECFVALHFSDNILKNNIATITGHIGTDPKKIEKVTEFTKAIGMSGKLPIGIAS
jgi:3-hydroxyacyl-CoA dehydrogenase